MRWSIQVPPSDLSGKSNVLLPGFTSALKLELAVLEYFFGTIAVGIGMAFGSAGIVILFTETATR